MLSTQKTWKFIKDYTEWSITFDKMDTITLLGIGT